MFTKYKKHKIEYFKLILKSNNKLAKEKKEQKLLLFKMEKIWAKTVPLV